MSSPVRRQLLLIPRIKQRVRSRSCRLRLESSDLRATIPGSACLPGHLNKLSIPFSPEMQKYDLSMKSARRIMDSKASAKHRRRQGQGLIGFGRWCLGVLGRMIDVVTLPRRLRFLPKGRVGSLMPWTPMAAMGYPRIQHHENIEQ